MMEQIDMAKLIERDPILNVKNFYDLTRPQERAKYVGNGHTLTCK
jgi:hypothetical protein